MKVEDEGAKWISGSLKVNKSITSIDIRSKKFDNYMKCIELTSID